jgi:hypothetical protein
MLLFDEQCLVAASASKLFGKRSLSAHQQLNVRAAIHHADELRD